VKNLQENSEYGLQEDKETFIADEILWERVIAFVDETNYDGDVWSDEN